MHCTFFCPHSSEISENSLYFLKVSRQSAGLRQMSTSICSGFQWSKNVQMQRSGQRNRHLKKKRKNILGFVEITCCQRKTKCHVFRTETIAEAQAAMLNLTVFSKPS